ncbi:hypothetical protein GCM10009609_71190 [Pseudonocardia aurantiaca]|uniref:NADPH-dependent reductive aminase-like C-terminal domain-containing protein n=1 Tax=Pseudonocardia aurantiaca TaxID=75290 RepID=A0ABW4FXP2_9PSEU
MGPGCSPAGSWCQRCSGSESAYVFYSGPREVFDAHQPLLRLIGRPDYLGAGPRPAQLLYQAQLSYFLTALAGFTQAAALVGTAGVPASDYLPYAVDIADSVSMYLGQAAKQMDANDHPGTGDTTMMRASAAHVARTSLDSGLDTAVPDAVGSLYDHAVAAGRGNDSWTVLSEVVRRRLP